MGSNSIEARRQQVLEGLAEAVKKSNGCTLPEIPYELFKQAINLGIGSAVSPLRINEETDDPNAYKRYRHTMRADYNYQCYAPHPIDMSGNPIEPSEIPTMDDILNLI